MSERQRELRTAGEPTEAQEREGLGTGCVAAGTRPDEAVGAPLAKVAVLLRLVDDTAEDELEPDRVPPYSPG